MKCLCGGCGEKERHRPEWRSEVIGKKKGKISKNPEGRTN